MKEFTKKKQIYENPLASPQDTAGFVMEGQAIVTFPQGRMRMENKLDPAEGQKANYVYWCPEEFPDGIAVTWDFWPVKEPGLAMLFFAARGIEGTDALSPELNARDGQYQQYHSGDINTLHLSYFRRNPKWGERTFHTCNLRKSKGFHMVCRGADPIPSVMDAEGPYHMKLVKSREEVVFFINELPVLYWQDDGISCGPVLSGGKIGFRQMAPLIAEYANLEVHTV
jgi:hypothetical protein